MSKRTVPAESFVDTLSLNVDNKKMSDKEFREFVRNNLPIVIHNIIQLKEPNRPEDVMEFCPGAERCGIGDLSKKIWMEIPTRAGVCRADYGDYIVRDGNGEFSVRKG